MAIGTSRAIPAEIDYPDGDGKPMAETPIHRENLTDLIAMIDSHFAADPRIYVSGNMFLYYVEGDPKQNVSPDVFVTRGIPRDPEGPGRGIYKTWVEGKGPDLVIELTSPNTRREDEKKKFLLYRDVLKVREYFLFDPLDEYLKPPLKGYRLDAGQYRPIVEVEGRLPSEVLGLELERAAERLRLYDPATRAWLLRPSEAVARLSAELERAEIERDRLLLELAELRARLGEAP